MIAPTIARVRPSKTAHAWVGRSVLELKGDDPLAPVTLIAPNYYAGRQTRWALARADGYVNVRSMLLTDVAVQIAGLVRDAPEPLTPVLEESSFGTCGASKCASTRHRLKWRGPHSRRTPSLSD